MGPVSRSPQGTRSRRVSVGFYWNNLFFPRIEIVKYYDHVHSTCRYISNSYRYTMDWNFVWVINISLRPRICLTQIPPKANFPIRDFSLKTTPGAIPLQALLPVSHCLARMSFSGPALHTGTIWFPVVRLLDQAAPRLTATSAVLEKARLRSGIKTHTCAKHNNEHSHNTACTWHRHSHRMLYIYIVISLSQSAIQHCYCSYNFTYLLTCAGA